MKLKDISVCILRSPGCPVDWWSPPWRTIPQLPRSACSSRLAVVMRPPTTRGSPTSSGWPPTWYDTAYLLYCESGIWASWCIVSAINTWQKKDAMTIFSKILQLLYYSYSYKAQLWDCIQCIFSSMTVATLFILLLTCLCTFADDQRSFSLQDMPWCWGSWRQPEVSYLKEMS